mmetsp:Transcript_15993/g.48203  ORF Transcript_15993/g.48203 Transcript_15993/m.48203 type:complete len:235 (+) Transcript_15993:498-1202(+)
MNSRRRKTPISDALHAAASASAATSAAGSISRSWKSCRNFAPAMPSGPAGWSSGGTSSTYLRYICFNALLSVVGWRMLFRSMRGTAYWSVGTATMSCRSTTSSQPPSEMLPRLCPRRARALISALTASGKARQTPGEPQARSRNSQRGGSATSKAASQSASHLLPSICRPPAWSSMLAGSVLLDLSLRGCHTDVPPLISWLPVLSTGSSRGRPPAQAPCYPVRDGDGRPMLEPT